MTFDLSPCQVLGVAHTSEDTRVYTLRVNDSTDSGGLARPTRVGTGYAASDLPLDLPQRLHDIHGRYAWLLDDARPITPVPTAGQLVLWTLEPDLARELPNG